VKFLTKVCVWALQFFFNVLVIDFLKPATNMVMSGSGKNYYLCQISEPFNGLWALPNGRARPLWQKHLHL